MRGMPSGLPRIMSSSFPSSAPMDPQELAQVRRRCLAVWVYGLTWRAWHFVREHFRWFLSAGFRVVGAQRSMARCRPGTCTACLISEIVEGHQPSLIIKALMPSFMTRSLWTSSGMPATGTRCELPMKKRTSNFQGSVLGVIFSSFSCVVRGRFRDWLFVG